MIFKCRRCNSRNYRIEDRGKAIGIYCDDCHEWNGWINRKKAEKLIEEQKNKNSFIKEDI